MSDGRIRYHRNDENMGASWNFNRVFELSVGKYFKWAASDPQMIYAHQIICYDVLKYLIGILACALCFPQTVMIDEFGNEIGNNITGLNLTSPKEHERYKQLQESLTDGHSNSARSEGIGARMKSRLYFSR